MASFHYLNGRFGATHICEYCQKYYQNQLLKGKGDLFQSVYAKADWVFLFFNTNEYFGRSSAPWCADAFLGFLAVLVYLVGFLCNGVIQPLIHLYGLKNCFLMKRLHCRSGIISRKKGDKLVNTLQLRNLTGSQSDLIEASIRAKIRSVADRSLFGVFVLMKTKTA